MTTYIARVGLYNLFFVGKSREVRLGEFVVYSPPANAYRYEERLDSGGKTWYSGTMDLTFPPVPYMDLEYESDPEHYVERAKELCQPLVTLLRLFKEGRVHGMPCRIWDKLAAGDVLETLVKDSIPLNLIQTELTYKLDDNDIAKLEAFFAALVGVDQSDFSVAISRFNDSYARGTERDRFIDLLIALEALFGDGGDSVGYKISLRCACFLGKFPGVGEGKQQIFDFLKKTYNERSDILHGRRKSLDWASVETCLKLENLVRQSIVRMLLEAKAGNALTPAKLDRLLFLAQSKHSENVL